MAVIIKIKTKRMIAGIILALAIILISGITNGSIEASIFFAFLFLLSGAIDCREIKNERIKFWWILLWISIICFSTLFLSQLIQNEILFFLSAPKIFLGFVCCIVPTLFIFCISMQAKFAGIVVSLLLLILSTVNNYVYRFRGSELYPSDLTTAGTAVNVLQRYNLDISGYVLYSWTIFSILVFLSFGLPKFKIKEKWKIRGVSLALLSCLILCFLFASESITVQHFTHGGSYYNGFLLNFTLQIKETIVHKPKDYSYDSIKKISQEYPKEKVKNREKAPDIIVIMDEAYSDLGVLGSNINTNIAISPFIDSLKENTTYGYTLTSVYGGGTPNSEYEFLSGNSLLFVKGIIYQQYLRKPSYSLVSVLKEKGYNCIAMHPYLETGWKRNTVWPNLLFDECLFMDDFPQKNLMRGLVSDQEMFEIVLEKYNSNIQESEDPVFIFGVTMQNHSDYEYRGKDFQNMIELQGYHGDYPDVEQYLSLIHETDQAVEYLLTELQKADRDVVVVFYGDHQPAVNEAFLKEVHGGAIESLDEKQLLQQVPFFIWTNYESESRKIELTSLNFLSNYLFEISGLELPTYNTFLRDVERVVPAMNAHGFYSKTEKRFLEYSEATGAEKEWLDKYWLLEYNALCDLKNLDTHFFPLTK